MPNERKPCATCKRDVSKLRRRSKNSNKRSKKPSGELKRKSSRGSAGSGRKLSQKRRQALPVSQLNERYAMSPRSCDSAAMLIIADVMQAEEENSKKRKLEQETKVPLKKPATQSSRPMTNSSSSHRISSLAQSQGRPAPNTSANPLTKSGGANSMIGQKFMSNQIRLPDSSSSRPVAAGPSTTVPKPFGLSASQGASRPPVALQGSALRPPPPPASAHKPDPEPYQELPEIDSE